jgi:hypothetical protein
VVCRAAKILHAGRYNAPALSFSQNAYYPRADDCVAESARGVLTNVRTAARNIVTLRLPSQALWLERFR